ncbi:unnamed protein product [Soboliphyme baturini]|uniref:BET1-like protein n=1 Tax=Soboliphyme baturini TaxID=241478 RepID=A0A183J3A3_9BILA|nr:unnamed protein product [Soboliphyme baturini]
MHYLKLRRQNKELDSMETEFDVNRNVLGSTMRRLGLINKSGGCSFMCYLISFAFGVFVVIYYLSRQ